MISKDKKRVKVQDIIENQFPNFVREDFPLLVEFLKQYYVSQEYTGSPKDLIENIDNYLKLDTIKNVSETATLVGNVQLFDTTIFVGPNQTLGYPDNYGLIQIDDEIILYGRKNNNSFLDCVRGFSGVTSFRDQFSKNRLVFSETEIDTHTSGSEVKNLSYIFFKEFLVKIKSQFSPGFENKSLYQNSQNNLKVNESLFVKQVKDFYKSKGTSSSFDILFKALYNENVKVIKPSDNLFRPSDAEYRITRDLVVESILGNPLNLLNKTLYQDEYPEYGIRSAYGTIGNIEKLIYNEREYYRLSVDFDYSKDITLNGSVYGQFSTHPITKVLQNVPSGSTFIDVDSTIGFPDSGNLVVRYSDGTSGIVRYGSKSYNQFFDITGITGSIRELSQIRLDVFAYGYSNLDSSEIIQIRIGSVLSDLNVFEDSFYYTDGDTAKIKSLGIEKSIPQTDSWLYNLKTFFNINGSLTLLNSSDFTYRCGTYLDNNFRVGDSIVISSSFSETYSAKITDIINGKTFSFNGQGTIIPTENRFFKVERNLSKPSLHSTSVEKYSYIEKINSDIQNTYSKFTDEVLVTSSSIPSTEGIRIFDNSIRLSGPYNAGVDENGVGISTQLITFPQNIVDHGFYTGDKVYYQQNFASGSNIISGLGQAIYCVKRIDSNSIKLSASLSNIYASYNDTNESDRNSRFISIRSGVTTSYFGTLIPLDFLNKNLEHQHLIKEIKKPINDGNIYNTEPGTTGILIDGVEVLNYKSPDYIYYGKIENIEVSASGKNYDIINPPVLQINDERGSGAAGHCSILGSLKRIDILDPGFDYIDNPIITISGGNGTGATAEVNTSLITHSVNFYSDSLSAYISTSTYTIGFSTYHKFRNYEEVVYKTDGQIGVGGLSTDSSYYVGLIDANTLNLFGTRSDAISGINTIQITSFGVGVHRLVATNKKRVLTGITITNSGVDYENKKRVCGSSGINTALDQVNIENHGYNNGDIITYSNTSTIISGLSTNLTYIVTKVDDNNFKLSNVGLALTERDFYFNTKQYINFESSGSGLHIFNYEPISVSIQGNTGVTTFSSSRQNWNAEIQPIFRGSISSAQLTQNGNGYGVEDIIGLNRQPVFVLNSGSGGKLLPITNNGQIVEVLVISPGSGYNSPPDLIINGLGSNAKVTPIINNGQIVNVVINNPGSGYDNTTSIDVIASGSEANLRAKIQSWNINLFQKKFKNITEDDGFLHPSQKFGVKYTYMYAPRKLRRKIYGRDSLNTIKYNDFDLNLGQNQEEISSSYHSPIIGWSYDGNPIYGPYGFSTPSGGNIRLMRSGYSLKSNLNNDQNRPRNFPAEFFVEDFIFTNTGDLDEHNGRFCITPEFPNGVYAYFATINVGLPDGDGPFNKYKRPIFPYLIGNTFKSKPNEFNFNAGINQKNYNINNTDWFRNTKLYNLNKKDAGYNSITIPSKVINQTIDLKSSKGAIESVEIISGGNNYKVGDQIIFEKSPTNRNAIAKVEKISGKQVSRVSTSSTFFENVEISLLRGNTEYIAFTEIPHNFKNLDIVYISGLSTNTRNLQRNFNVGVSSETFTLSSGIGTVGNTGITTYINILGNLNYPHIREDDILQIQSEQIKVLSVDRLNSRIRVLREYNNTVGSSYTSTTSLVELTRKLRFSSSQENISFSENRRIYFNPIESIGLGVTYGVGIGTTLTISNPGAGVSQVFVPSRSIYLPNHGLNTGDSVLYSFNQGSSIGVSTNGIGSTTLNNNSILYVAKIDNNLIGISTFRVGLGTTGIFAGVTSETSSMGLLYFTGIGTGSYHSFQTNKESLTATISKNLVNVSLSSTDHRLQENDIIDFELKSRSIFSINVKYNEYNRRIVFNPKSFTSNDVDIENNTIYIPNHGYSTGDKIIHTSSSPCGGLVNEKMYFVIKHNDDKIKLSDTYFGSTQIVKSVVNITSSSLGTLSSINPQVKAYRNSIVRFNLSDSSLSYSQSNTQYSAFKLNFYEDSNFTTIFESSKNNNTFEITKVGNIGFSGSYIDIRISDFIPNEIYYKFIPTNDATLIKKEIVIDNEVINNNKILVKTSEYQGTHVVSGIGSTSFTFDLNTIPEKLSYTDQEAFISYKTRSRNASGPISDIIIIDGGGGYSYSPGISTIKTNNGSLSILYSQSTSIGSIVSYDISDIGFDYPSDNTLRPVCNLPEILKIEPLSSFREIGISSAGKNYLTAPDLVVIDTYTNSLVDDVDLRYSIGDTKVTILKNTFGLYNREPKIIPVNNTNGVGIRSITYNESTKNVSVFLNSGFSDSFPFSIGDRVLIENVSVGIATTGYGYNSQNYNYSLFTLTGVHPGLGGNVGVVTYNLSNHLPNGRIPGNFDSVNSSGRIVAEKDFPIFNSILKKNDFLSGEVVFTNSNSGVVESWNNKIEILKVSTENDFSVGEILTGRSSNTRGFISKKYDFNADITLASTSLVKRGWENEYGFLNSDFERLSDNFYYQKFSYALKSKVPIQDWNTTTSLLNHTAGYLKFSNLEIESENSIFDEFLDRQNNFGVTSVIVDLYQEKDIDCYSAYDYATENSLNLNSRQISDEIYFRNSVLTDYFESFGNRVLLIDDISLDFNNNERITKYSIVDRFNLESTYKKYFILAQDSVFVKERKFSIVSLLQDGNFGYLNEYANLYNILDLGYYDFFISGSEGNLTFYPTKFSANNYNITHVSFDIKSGISGIGSIPLGDIVDISSTQTAVSVGTTTNIVSIANTYRSSKVLVQIKDTNNRYQVDEINLLHDGSDVNILNYGTIRNTISEYSSGLGTYNAYISGNNINLDFIPNSNISGSVDTIRVSISNTSFTGIGTQYLSDESNTISALQSNFVSISSSPTPTENIIFERGNEYSGTYFIVSIEDKTNNAYEMLELFVINDDEEVYFTEYGNISSQYNIGTFSADLNGNNIRLKYTPIPNSDVDIRLFGLSIKSATTGPSPTSAPTINLSNTQISSGFDYYYGTLIDVRRSFELRSANKPIFKRYFDGSSTSVVDLNENTITIPEHFFVTGEEVRYSYVGLGTTNAIGIATTSFAGIGLTNTLPSSLFVIKVDDTKIKLARSAEDALKSVPISLDLLSVGYTTSHSITGINQNSRCLISIDNLIQSPLVSTSTTTYLTQNLEVSTQILHFDSVEQFIGGDLIKIDDEIMKINTVGFGSTNMVLVDRPWMGTGISTHASGSEIVKVSGDYNIVENTIHFISAPYGNIPLSSTSNPPDERDWVGITTRSKFHGRSFLRSGQKNTSQSTYTKNYIFDDISDEFDSFTKDFILTSESQNITGIEQNNAIILINNIFQSPSGSLVVRQDYSLLENSGVTSIRFTGSAASVSYDPNVASVPSGGTIVSVASTEGLGYQPLVSAAGTSIVSIAGTISSISIGNSGSGYRVGIQTFVNVGVYTSSPGLRNIEYIGTAQIQNGHVVGVSITNPGTGYTSSNPPIVVFDSPLNYSNIPLIYSSSSSGIGTGAKVDIVVGQGSSIIDFEITNTGYNYRRGDILTINAGSLSGIQTNPHISFREFQIIVDRVESDKFSGWHVGELEILDSIESLFDGQRRSFPISKDGSLVSIRVSPGSNIDIQSTLLVFINDVLQVPGEGYTFSGGSTIVFPEAPKGPDRESNDPNSADRCKILFYKGSGDIDVIFRDVLETIKIGDKLTMNGDDFICEDQLQQDSRIITDILSSNSVETITYDGPGINGNPDCYRTIDWCKQKDDLVINGLFVSKSRIYYEPLINPISYLIQPVGSGDTIFYVDSIRPFFNQENENSTLQNRVTLISQEEKVAAAATAIVSVAGTITSIVISDGGKGYTNVPSVTIQNPIGIGSTATASASINVGIVTNISIIGPGTGYNQTNPPIVLIDPPKTFTETNEVLEYYGDFGRVVGFGITSSSGISTITFDLLIENDSFMRNSSLSGIAVTISEISYGDFIVINDSNIGIATTSITSIKIDTNSIGIGTQFLNNVYQVSSATITQKYIVGIGTTYVRRITTATSEIDNTIIDSTFDLETRNYIYSGGITTSSYFGYFSWGKIYLESRESSSTFEFYGDNGTGGITTSAIVRRTNPLKYQNYYS